MIAKSDFLLSMIANDAHAPNVYGLTSVVVIV
jgi:hypothetical protein